ncbi:MAG: tRNA (guanosine(46)-N7)-methyltransferase TrmB [Bacilli bacterium]|nr:tRNA (guanosine(46)-N7)-methyltransferase TrmB [Bacilli bacterium]
MRLKKIKNADTVVLNSPFTINNPKEYKGKYKETFKKEIYVEIGSGRGKFIYEMAKINPNIMFIAVEKYASALYKLVKRLELDPVDNLKLVCTDASEIDDIFDKDISILYLNFSDPWPKKRHHKRRLTSDIFLDKYESIFFDKKEIVMKTDNQDLFEYSVVSFVNHNYKIKNIYLDLHNADIFNIKTEYEEKFSKKGFRIYKIEVYK